MNVSSSLSSSGLEPSRPSGSNLAPLVPAGRSGLVNVKCNKCEVESLTFACICGEKWCIMCGIDQGEWNPESRMFADCEKCCQKKPKTILEDLEMNGIPLGWEDYFDCNMGLLKTISKQVEKASANATVFPPVEDVFNAFRKCKPQDIKVLLLAQDVYHGPNQAHGLAFSVRDGIKPPPSLVNIYTELKNDGFGVSNETSGDLTKWAQKGVFLLNKGLTVEQAKPGSHLKVWDVFTDQAIRYFNYQCENVVVILLGAPARKSKSLINRHEIVEAVHPSPLSAHGGFFGSRIFSRTNELLVRKGREPIDWSL